MGEQTASKVPQIRFKGFEAEWEEATVSDFVLSLDAGVSVNSGDRAANSAEFGILKTSAVTNGVFEADENKVVLTESEQSRLKESISGGTIIISRMNTPALVGANAYVESNHENLFLPDRLWAAKPRDGTSMRFLASILGSEKGRDALSKLAKGTSGSMKNITKPDVLAVSVIAPPPPEQTQIGEYFRELDSLIGLHQRKHDKLVTLKKAMLQKMFPQPGATTPEIRFKGFLGEWVENKLGEVMAVGSVKRIHQSDWTKAGVRFLRARDIVSAYKNEDPADILYISQAKYDEYSLLSGKVELGDLLVTGVGTIGISYLIRKSDPVYFKDGNIIWFKNHGALNGDFLYYSFVGERIQNYIKESAGTGTVGTYTISCGKNTPFASPLTEEQQKIGTYFRTLDELISKHAIQLQKLQQLKSACLEKMFV